MALIAKYNLQVYEADTAAEIADTVFPANYLVTAIDSGETKKGNGVDPFSDLPVFGGGGGSGTPSFTELTGTVADATGANLQEILNDLATRVTALEAV